MFLSIITAVFMAVLLGETGGLNWAAIALF